MERIISAQTEHLLTEQLGDYFPAVIDVHVCFILSIRFFYHQ